MIRIIVLFLIFSKSVFSQYDKTTVLEDILQGAINNSEFISHIKKQNCISLNSVEWIKPDSSIDTNVIIFNDKLLKVNDFDGAEKFSTYWDFDFTHIAVEGGGADISFKFIPTWITCEGSTSQSGAIFYLVNVDLVYENNEWKSQKVNIKEVDLDMLKKVCLIEKYSPL